jgi:hypothetical protein
LPYKSDEEAAIDGEVYVNLSVFALTDGLFWPDFRIFKGSHLGIFSGQQGDHHTVGIAL